MNLPNYITIFRIFLVPVFFTFLIYFNANHPNFRLIALCLFSVAILTDALDGIIARRYHKKTELGTFLDPFADKLLLLSAFLGILMSEALMLKPPVWVVVIIVFRDLFIIFGLVIIFLTTMRLKIQPDIFGKLTTFFQMLTVFFVLAQWKSSVILWYLTAGLTILSSISYLIHGIKMLNVRPASARSVSKKSA
ncbi:MAG: CDP-alcohol phosphatidyltransferase family protein [Candidatus Omnitrophica bacterium]|nr:CDP-alcohol phosphatidyltransferase family protein [Candidatus Omnitrophota bacterium]